MNHQIHLSPEILAVAALAASKYELSVDLYIEALIREHGLPLIAASLGLGALPVPEAKAKAKAKKKKPRRRTRKSWSCPCCQEKVRPQGNKVHFLSCATGAGLTVREIAVFCQGDPALARMYGCDATSDVDEVEAGIRSVAKGINYTHRLIETSDQTDPSRSRLTAKTRLRK